MREPLISKRLRVFLRAMAALGALLASCSAWPAASQTGIQDEPDDASGWRITATPFQPLLATATSMTSPSVSTTTESLNTTPFPGVTSLPVMTSTPQATLTSSPAEGPGVWTAAYIPETLSSRLQLPSELTWSQSPENPGLRLEVGEENPLAQWVYALVAPFPTLEDGVASRDILRSWMGEPQGPFAERVLLMDESTAGVFTAWWGEPAAGVIEIVSAKELLDYAWEHRPAWALVPFEALERRWKVMEVDGQSPLRKDFEREDYALTIPFSITGDPQQTAAILTLNKGEGNGPHSNREADKLTTVALTGVTALVRATAWTMERNGINYPAEDIGELLRQADITHVSNEIPFDPNCPPPNPSQADLRFCSDPEYIALMEVIGTDVVELTGDHFADRGPEAMDYTLDLYDQQGWMVYGGGRDRKEARRARLVEHNGNRLAFIGCNAKGGGYATASETAPGAVACDFDWMHAEIESLREQGYQVLATFQHFEYYSYYPQPLQVTDFGGMAQAGASIVSGSQAHQPQGMAFEGDAFIHYGLGNLFFDQYQFCTDNACDDGFIDRHIFYDGRYIGTELVTIRFVDYARPRLMTAEERTELLDKVFRASGW